MIRVLVPFLPNITNYSTESVCSSGIATTFFFFFQELLCDV